MFRLLAPLSPTRRLSRRSLFEPVMDSAGVHVLAPVALAENRRAPRRENSSRGGLRIMDALCPARGAAHGRSRTRLLALSRHTTQQSARSISRRGVALLEWKTFRNLVFSLACVAEVRIGTRREVAALDETSLWRTGNLFRTR